MTTPSQNIRVPKREYNELGMELDELSAALRQNPPNVELARERLQHAECSYNKCFREHESSIEPDPGFTADPEAPWPQCLTNQHS